MTILVVAVIAAAAVSVLALVCGRVLRSRRLECEAVEEWLADHPVDEPVRDRRSRPRAGERRGQ